MSYTIMVNGEYFGSSASCSVIRMNRAQLYEPKQARVGEIVRARVNGAYTLYSVANVESGKVWLAGADRDTDQCLGKFYLAGPMRGYALHNFPAFLTAAAHLRGLGFTIVDPATHDMANGFDLTRSIEDQKFDIQAALGWDFAQIVECDGIILLDGWEKSTGAKAERLVAEMTGKQVLRLNAALELFAEDDWKSELTWDNGKDIAIRQAPKAIVSEKP